MSGLGLLATAAQMEAFFRFLPTAGRLNITLNDAVMRRVRPNLPPDVARKVKAAFDAIDAHKQAALSGWLWWKTGVDRAVQRGTVDRQYAERIRNIRGDEAQVTRAADGSLVVTNPTIPGVSGLNGLFIPILLVAVSAVVAALVSSVATRFTLDGLIKREAATRKAMQDRASEALAALGPDPAASGGGGGGAPVLGPALPGVVPPVVPPVVRDVLEDIAGGGPVVAAPAPGSIERGVSAAVPLVAGLAVLAIVLGARPRRGS